MRQDWETAVDGSVGGGGGACGGTGGGGGLINNLGQLFAGSPGSAGYLLQTQADPTALFP